MSQDPPQPFRITDQNIQMRVYGRPDGIVRVDFEFVIPDVIPVIGTEAVVRIVKVVRETVET